MKNRRSRYMLTLVLIVGIVGLLSQFTVAASMQPTPLESHSQHSWTGNTWSHSWSGNTWTVNTWSHSWSQHTNRQVTVTVVSTASNQRHGGWSNGGGYYGGNYYGQYNNQNPYYNPYCPADSSYCSQYPYYQNPNAQNCPVYNSQNPYCYPYYNYSPNYCVNSPYCSPYTASQYPYPYATTTQQFTPQVIIQNITVTQSITATPTPTTQVTLAASTEANTDQTAIGQYYLPLIATCVALSTIAAIAVLLLMSRRNRAQRQPSQAVTSQQFTPQQADKKFCHRCGSGLGSDSLYCASCGTRVI
jgi:hypothetical protein